MSTTIPITLPGRPVTAQLDPDALPRYLLAHGWRESSFAAGWRTFFLGECSAPVEAPTTAGVMLERALLAVAEREGRHPLDVLADLLPPSSAPVAWAHLSVRQRLGALADAAGAAASLTRQAARERLDYPEERALETEGRAAALLALAELGRRAL